MIRGRVGSVIRSLPLPFPWAPGSVVAASLTRLHAVPSADPAPQWGQEWGLGFGKRLMGTGGSLKGRGQCGVSHV